MKVIGITSGIGSLEYGFRKEGFDILHHHEWRDYYNTGTFEKNYGTDTFEDYEPQPKFKGVDVVVSHPECGNFSNLYCGPNREIRKKDPGDIYKFMDLCKAYDPAFFLVDNLPGSLGAVSPDDWEEYFPEHDIHFELVSNWGYGNTQKYRNRLFTIGSHKDLNFKFVAHEIAHNKTLGDVIGDIRRGTANHNKMQLEDLTQWSGYQIGIEGDKNKLTLDEMQDWFGKMETRKNMPYYNLKGEKKSKPGYSIVERGFPSSVLSGGGSFYDNHWIFDEEEFYYRPLTMRERLRIQGFGDEFELSHPAHEWGSPLHRNYIKQTGKSMPTEFPSYFARLIKDHIENGPMENPKNIKIINQIDLSKYVRYSDPILE